MAENETGGSPEETLAAGPAAEATGGGVAPGAGDEHGSSESSRVVPPDDTSSDAGTDVAEIFEGEGGEYPLLSGGHIVWVDEKHDGRHYQSVELRVSFVVPDGGVVGLAMLVGSEETDISAMCVSGVQAYYVEGCTDDDAADSSFDGGEEE